MCESVIFQRVCLNCFLAWSLPKSALLTQGSRLSSGGRGGNRVPAQGLQPLFSSQQTPEPLQATEETTRSTKILHFALPYSERRRNSKGDSEISMSTCVFYESYFTDYFLFKGVCNFVFCLSLLESPCTPVNFTKQAFTNSLIA